MPDSGEANQPRQDGSEGAGQPAASQPLIVVSNREPYLHSFAADGSLTWSSTTGGVAVALDALMRERGGIWIAHGAGEADRLVVDREDRLWVPPGEALYRLHRIWLTSEEEEGYYAGFANEGLWPLCHEAHVRPVFRSSNWAHYQLVNARFADAIARGLGPASIPVFIHDYHLALVASELRARRPEARTALFWHIPWPHPDRLRICPWRREIMEGLLANDLLAFQIERDRRNFMAAAREELGAEVAPKLGRIVSRGRTTMVVAAPIGVDFDRIQTMAKDPAMEREMTRLRAELQAVTPVVGVGVDRLDYTKGIPERLEAVNLLLERRPDLRGRLTFVQIGVPSRSRLESYAAIEAEIDAKVAEINERYRDGRYVPIRYRKSALKGRRLVALFRLATFCIVSSLHDGMNLVAKEFVATRDDLDGVLVLSELAGAAQELREAVLINPYDVEGFAASLERTLNMSRQERTWRMRALRRTVAGHDVFSWASGILEQVEGLTETGARAARLPALPRTRWRLGGRR